MKVSFILILVCVILTSCKKDNLHKIKFQITFLEIPEWYQSNMIEVYLNPYYSGKYNYSTNENGVPIAPSIDYEMTTDGLWEYEYWELKNGDRVTFSIWGQLKYHYELRVFIDEKEVSYKRIKISNQNYNSSIGYEENGRDDTPGDGVIDFIF